MEQFLDYKQPALFNVIQLNQKYQNEILLFACTKCTTVGLNINYIVCVSKVKSQSFQVANFFNNFY